MSAALLFAPHPASAQASAAAQALPELPGPAASGASAPRRGQPAPGPRPRSMSETAQRAAVPGELRPERPVAPQVSIPLGRKPPNTAPAEDRAGRRNSAPATGGIDDDTARCDSIQDTNQRDACLARAERAAKGRLPG